MVTRDVDGVVQNFRNFKILNVYINSHLETIKRTWENYESSEETTNWKKESHMSESMYSYNFVGKTEQACT